MFDIFNIFGNSSSRLDSSSDRAKFIYKKAKRGVDYKTKFHFETNNIDVERVLERVKSGQKRLNMDMDIEMRKMERKMNIEMSKVDREMRKVDREKRIIDRMMDRSRTQRPRKNDKEILKNYMKMQKTMDKFSIIKILNKDYPTEFITDQNRELVIKELIKYRKAIKENIYEVNLNNNQLMKLEMLIAIYLGDDGDNDGDGIKSVVSF